MTLVVGLSTVVTQEIHRVTRGNMLGVVAHKLLHAIPQSRDSVEVLVQTQHKTVFLVVLLHKPERVHGEVTEQLDARLHPPVEFVVHHQRMTEEKSRLIATHMPVALRVAVDDFLLSHLLPGLLGLLLVNPLGIGPVLLGDGPVVCCS